MAILNNAKTSVIIQGMTGKEGQRALEWMIATGTKVVAGVTPGKGGQTVQDIPVYNSVAEAVTNHPSANLSCLYVPPKFTLSAAREAMQAGIRLLHVLAEGVPSRDTAEIIELARASHSRIIGPSSIGFASSGIGAIGSMGGGDMSQFLPPDKNNGVAILSKSGGMANTVATLLTGAGIPQSTIVGLGGDRLIGTTYADLLPDLAADDKTAAVVIVGEIGGAYEEMLAAEMERLHFTKPVVAFISGLFAETLPQGVAFGHAGAIVSKHVGTRKSKIEALIKAGAHIAQSPTDVPLLLKKLIQ